MKVISNEPKSRVVELTHREQVASAFFEECLDEGMSCVQAGDELRSFELREGRYDERFIGWLETGLPS